MTYSLSATKIVTYKQCLQAYSFRYERGINAPGALDSPELNRATSVVSNGLLGLAL